MLHGKHFQSGGKTSRERLRSGVSKAAFRSLRRSGARLAFGGAFVRIDLFADPVRSRYLCGVMFAALRIPALLRLWRCVLSRFFALACGIDRSLSLLWRHAYGFAYFCAFMFAVYGSLYFCAVEAACRCGVMFLLLSFSAASGF